MFETRTEPAFGAIRVEEPKTSSLRNQLLSWCKIIASKATQARARGARSKLVESFLLQALAATSELSAQSVAELAKWNLKADYIHQLVGFMNDEGTTPEVLADLENQVREGVDGLEYPTAEVVDEMIAQGAGYLPDARSAALGPTLFGLSETLTAALVGVASLVLKSRSLCERAWLVREDEAEGLRASYVHVPFRERSKRRKELAAEADAIRADVQRMRDQMRETIDGLVDAVGALATDDLDEETLYSKFKVVGGLVLNALELSEFATTSQYGVPNPIGVLASPKPGKCVLFSGDDFEALAELLAQAEYHELNVWTRGEALAAHAYPFFRAKKRLIGHYGGSWRDQVKEIGAFPGATVASGSPIEEPDDSYAAYIFSCAPTACESIAVVGRKSDGSYDFSNAFHAAKDSPGFFRVPTSAKIPIGFGGANIPSLVEQSASAYRTNALKKVVVICGQDFPNDSNDYFARLFENIPEESFALTFGDVKFRFNRLSTHPTSFGVPKIVDFGRERDANAALRFAGMLEKELDRKPEDSPATFFVSLWGELSIALVFALVAKGYGATVGPFAPACWNDAIKTALQDRFGVKVATNPVADLSR